MGFSKEIREIVYNKYNGHCAYCGKEITYKDMQVDHFIPLNGWEKSYDVDLNSIDNLMPACRRCNHYKRAHSLEVFRKYIEEIPQKLRRDNYIYKVGLDYGNIIEDVKPIKFYFELDHSGQTAFNYVKSKEDSE